MWNYASQNIGAYGTEIKTLCFLRVMAIESLDMKTFTKTNVILDTEKAFFKTKQKNQYIITSVVLN
jgi:UDP-N-acetylenolpyruvoylglucosamine reductase